VLVLWASFLIDHFDLFGLRQVFFYLRGIPYQRPVFATSWLYRFARHPLYLGWMIAFWSTPTMTAAHLTFALATTGYILIAIQLEESDLIAAHGSSSANYRRQVPMLIPRLSPRRTFADDPAPACASASLDRDTA
jgi:protein-S-isoprenylcysteine O-methyltransferase Ste14